MLASSTTVPVFSDGHPRNLLASHLPAKIGLGLKPQHFTTIVTERPDVGFFEIHAENYLVGGGPFHHFLEKIAHYYPLSIHGVGLSIGGQKGISDSHLKKVTELVKRYQPASFSEHLAWSTHNDFFLNDLLPLPYTNHTLDRVCTHVSQIQDAMQRELLLENPSTYIEFSESTWSEADFMTEVIARTGCGLLLDVNNVYISSINHHRDPSAMLKALPLSRVGEIHLAGYAEQQDSLGAPLLIDSHDRSVSKEVWNLYETALQNTGAVATLIEWDSNIPDFSVLMSEVSRAQRFL
ncbi:DUF692 domain-containing protein [Pantoea ananatis]|uniref:MNIO family bufferin maturase n=1 Tax=Pantoea ananas TaxID=553 RepID=UPI0004AC838C|nr:DUF692 domain-containing protein [Pantoea ananatis]